MNSETVFTIGHSTHSLEEFVALLGLNSIESLVDIRTVPKSRRNPHFHTDSLKTSIPEHGIAYRHLASLGGWRKADKDSVNDAWRNKSFRGYADYTLTDEFAAGIADLKDLAAEQATAIMCSEALWWRCHRRLVADRLTTEGVQVLHIGSDGKTSIHELTDFAEVDDEGRITYPG